MFCAPAPGIRDYRADDQPAVLELFHASVQTLAAAHYDAAQRQAWAPAVADRQAWQARLSGLLTRAMEDRGRLAGFIACSDEGPVDLLYTAPAHARQGVALALYRGVEATLQEAGVTRLFTKASLAARPVFERQGLAVDQLQAVRRGTLVLRRFAMSKALSLPIAERPCGLEEHP